MSNPYSQTTPEIERYADLCQENGLIEPSLYNKHKVNRVCAICKAGACSQVLRKYLK